MYKVVTSDSFNRDVEKLDNSLQIPITNIIEQLENDPYAGRSLKYPFFREKRIKKNYRLYYLIYEEYVAILVIAINSKKQQDETIDKILRLLPDYKEEVRMKLSGIS